MASLGSESLKELYELVCQNKNCDRKYESIRPESKYCSIPCYHVGKRVGPPNPHLRLERSRIKEFEEKVHRQRVPFGPVVFLMISVVWFVSISTGGIDYARRMVSTSATPYFVDQETAPALSLCRIYFDAGDE